ncbi:hypothetical protein CHS0354_001153 [Potamilus streckersoni]|uniref:NTR domain-containing protein n=1 Tax=Potamilus streckersoni TaxID=2493646 RepID=A0AAE0S706_9BIVA|nr:hypothetical protein CHS0354_001153 [Potamilus streckersoni]
MERSTMFLHSLLVLLVVIQVTFACNCRPMTLGQAMCNSTTVILARVTCAGDDSVAVVMNEIEVQQTFKVETTPISLNDGYGYMTFPQSSTNCGGKLRTGIDYIIAGNVDANGVLVSSNCKYITEYEPIVQNKDYVDILQGDVDCTNV